MQQDTIAGIASGMGGGIGIIRVSGENAFSIVGEIFRTKKFLDFDDKSGGVKASLEKKELWDNCYFLKKNSHTIHYGFIIEDNGNILDEVMVLLMKAWRSLFDSKNIEVVNTSWSKAGRTRRIYKESFFKWKN